MLGQRLVVICPSCGKTLLKGRIKNVFIWWCSCPDWELFCPDLLPAHHPKSFARAGKGVDLDTTREMSDKQLHHSQALLDAIEAESEEEIPTRVDRPKAKNLILRAGITDIEGLVLQISKEKNLPKTFVDHDHENDVITAHPFSTNPETKKKKKP